jgi:outer membrane protein
MRRIFLSMCALVALSAGAQQQWTLQDCIDYAMQHNIAMRKAVLSEQVATETRRQSQAALFPSLTARTSQNVGYTPWTTGPKTTSYNGSYGLSADWTLWNGNQNRNQVKLNKLAEKEAEADRERTSLSLQEQIAQLYVQLLYTNEAVNVSRENLETSKKNEERGLQMQEVGKMSQADVAQLTAQRASDEYSLVEMESNLQSFKQQMKQLLQMVGDQPFDVATPVAPDEQALAPIPALADVYALALQARPELRKAELAVKESDVQLSIAKAGHMPTVSLTGSAATGTNSGNSDGWGQQMKNNVDLSAGLGVSVPLFDNRRTRTNINKAKIQQSQARVEQEKARDDMYLTLEEYWLDAQTNQQKFRAAQLAVDSEQQSYDLLAEQFRLGLKNIVELMTGKVRLLQAQQNKLQSKYLSILSLQMLHFYQGDPLTI